MPGPGGERDLRSPLRPHNPDQLNPELGRGLGLDDCPHTEPETLGGPGPGKERDTHDEPADDELTDKVRPIGLLCFFQRRVSFTGKQELV